mgnify:CR=1 FL=1
MNFFYKFFLLIIATFFASCTTDADDDDVFDASKVCPETGTNAYGMPNRGTFTDERDGQTYKYTTIGKQVWMAQNLNYHVEQDDSCAYAEDDCVQKGRLYFKKNIFDACPNEWHLPSHDEWEEMIDKIGGFKIAGYFLKSKEGWLGVDSETDANGTDDCGFSVLPSIVSDIKYDGYEADFWAEFVDKETGKKDLWMIVVHSDVDTIMSKRYFSDLKYSVRCVMN